MTARKIATALALVLVGLVAGRTDARAATAPNDVPEVGGEALTSHVRGTLRVTVVERLADGWRVRARLVGASYAQNPPPSPAAVAALDQPFFFTAKASGELGDFYFAKGIPAEARSLLEQLATSLQSVTPPAPATSWRTTERDESGAYEAAYTADGDRLVRTKSRYLEPKGLGGMVKMPMKSKYDVTSTTDIELGENGWPKAVGTDEAYAVDVLGARIEAKTSTKVALSSVADRPELVGRMARETVESEHECDLRDRLDAQRASDLKVVQGRSFDDIVRELVPTDKDARDAAQQEMTALLRLQPELLPRAEDEVVGESLDADGRTRMLGAIADSDTVPSQATLVDLLRGSDLDHAVVAAVRIGLLERPTAATVDALVTALDAPDGRVARTSLLAVGNMARRLVVNGADQAGADRLTDLVLQRLAQARDDSAARVAIEALGNSGDAKGLAALTPYLASPDAKLRAAAAASLRFIPGDETDRALSLALADADAGVRRAAVSAVPYRTVAPLLPGLGALMQAEAQDDVRLAVVNALNMKRDETPAVDALLTSISTERTDKAAALAKHVLTTGN